MARFFGHSVVFLVVSTIPRIYLFLVTTSIGLAATHFDKITSRVTVATHVANINGVAEVFVIQWCLKHNCDKILESDKTDLFCSMKIVSNYIDI